MSHAVIVYPVSLLPRRNLSSQVVLQHNARCTLLLHSTVLGDKDYHIGDEARAALQTKVGVRFFLRAKLKSEFRHSSDVNPLGTRPLGKGYQAVAEAVGCQLTHFAVHVNVIKLLSRRPYALICYHLFMNATRTHKASSRKT
ncbi:hypothetical protein VTI28DRAFT_6039 [Corynascus sepedonium]